MTFASVAPDASWTFVPGAIALLMLLAVVYVRRWTVARGEGGPRAAPVWRLLAFSGGLLCLVAALLSPVDRLAEQLMAAHMVQHMLLLDLSSVLLLLGLTRHILRPVTRSLAGLERRARWAAHPGFAVGGYVGLLWVWHIPALYELALRAPVVHVLEHVLFSMVGLLYWWHLLCPIPARRPMKGLWPVVYMAVTKVLVGLLGIGLTFAPSSLYGFYSRQPRFWGLSSTDDQALAGAIMALEQSVVMGAALVWLFIRALGASEREDRRIERFADRDVEHQQAGGAATAGVRE